MLQAVPVKKLSQCHLGKELVGFGFLAPLGISPLHGSTLPYGVIPVGKGWTCPKYCSEGERSSEAPLPPPTTHPQPPEGHPQPPGNPVPSPPASLSPPPRLYPNLGNRRAPGQGRGEPAAAPPTLPGRPRSVLRPLGRRDMAGASRTPQPRLGPGFLLGHFLARAGGGQSRAGPSRESGGSRRSATACKRRATAGGGAAPGEPPWNPLGTSRLLPGTPPDLPGISPPSPGSVRGHCLPLPLRLQVGSAWLFPPGATERGSEQARICLLLNVCACG